MKIENKKKILYYVVCFVLGAVVVFSVFFFFLFNRYQSICLPAIRREAVSGRSLAPFLKNGDVVNVDYNYYTCGREVKKGDLVIYEYGQPDNKLIKFVKAVPGDFFHLDDDSNILYINNEPLKNTEGKNIVFRQNKTKLLKEYEKSFAGFLKGEIYLLFGNRYDSIDSSTFGPALKKNILGKVISPEEAQRKWWQVVLDDFKNKSLIF